MELCKSLSTQQSRLDTTTKWASDTSKQGTLSPSQSFESKPDLVSSTESVDEIKEYSILRRVDKDYGVFVCGEKIVLLVAIANETNSTIILSDRNGLIGGFEGSPMPIVRVASGGSIKIPMAIPRMNRTDDNGETVDIAAELVKLMALQWESDVAESDDGKEIIKRTGRIKIPSLCLRQIINEHKSFACHICKQPVSVFFGVEARIMDRDISVSVGSPIRMVANVSINGRYSCYTMLCIIFGFYTNMHCSLSCL